MSWGRVICSVCGRTVRQNGPKQRVRNTFDDGFSDVTTWTHGDDGSPRCAGAQSVYPPKRDKEDEP